MTTQVRLRIDSRLAKEADAVCRKIGITRAEAVSMFFARMVKLRRLPFRPGKFPALEEYGVSLAQATATEESSLTEIRRERTAGTLKTFRGRL